MRENNSRPILQGEFFLRKLSIYKYMRKVQVEYDPDRHLEKKLTLDLQKKQILCQKLLYLLKIHY